jgi:hypothetical protein
MARGLENLSLSTKLPYHQYIQEHTDRHISHPSTQTFTARLTVHFPAPGRLCILNAASPVSARKTRIFCPICRNFDRDAELAPVYEFNYQVFAEDQEVVEAQYPEDLPLELRAESHIGADQTSIADRRPAGG